MAADIEIRGVDENDLLPESVNMAAEPASRLDSMPLATMSECLKELRSSGRPWRSVLQDRRFQVPRDQYRSFTNPQKGTFYRLLSPGRRRAFLEVGARSGIVSACLSEEYERGYALEIDSEFVEFMRLRFLMDSIANVQVLQGDALAIPLPDGSIDLTVIDGAVEWAPPADRRPAAGQVQLKILREIHRCLGAAGKIAIAVENAWDYRSKRGRAHRRSVHSYFGYRKLLTEAGYSKIRIFVVMPDFHLPIDIYSFDRQSLNELFQKYDSASRAKRAVKRLSDALGVRYLCAYFQRAFYIVGAK